MLGEICSMQSHRLSAKSLSIAISFFLSIREGKPQTQEHIGEITPDISFCHHSHACLRMSFPLSTFHLPIKRMLASDAVLISYCCISGDSHIKGTVGILRGQSGYLCDWSQIWCLFIATGSNDWWWCDRCTLCSDSPQSSRFKFQIHKYTLSPTQPQNELDIEYAIYHKRIRHVSVLSLTLNTYSSSSMSQWIYLKLVDMVEESCLNYRRN